MQKNINRLLLVATFVALIGNSANAVPSNINTTNMNFGGALLNHDMIMLKEKQRLHNEKVDFDNFHEKNQKNKENEDLIKDNTNSQTKTYSAETSKKLKEQREKAQKELEQKQTKKKFHFFKRKNKKVNTTLEELPDPKKQIIENDETKTKITTNEEKTNIVNGKVFIKSITVSKSRILSDYEIQALTDTVIGKYVSFKDLEELIQNFNYIYAVKGCVTARAFLPAQKIENGNINIDLVEGSVGRITIWDNKYTSSNYIRKRMNIKTGDIFQVVNLEKEIINFNKYNDGIKLKASLDKGIKEGTTDIKISAEEKFPFHVVGIMDNAGRKTIGELRGGLMMYSDSLFKQRDRLSIGAYKSRYSTTPFIDYNIPVNKYDGRVGFTFSSSFADIGRGPYKQFNISSESYNYSLYYTHPLVRKPNFELTSYTAGNYKEAATKFDGYAINRDQISSFETALNARWDTKRGIWYVNQGVYQAFPIFDRNSDYFKYTGNITRLHDFGHGIVGQLRGMYQYSPKDVMPYIDQFQAGGLATVRGYSEGLLIGRSGYIISAEVMFPIAPKTITFKTKKSGKKKLPFLGSVVKGIAFVDHAGIYPFKGEGPGSRSYTQTDYMVSTGLGLRIQLPGEASARLYWGYPLMHNARETYYRNPRFSFSLSVAPDFDKLLKYRKTLKNKEDL